MDCKDNQKYISMLIDGELEARSSEALQKHLVTCSACRNTYELMRELNETLNVVGLSWPPSMLASGVKARLAGQNGDSKGRFSSRAWRQVPLFAMIVLLAISLGNLAGRSITEMLVGAPSSEAKLQYLFTDADQSFSNIVLDIAVGENSR
jgi:predicted anti-sigma-YlaC factor YlaD